MFKFHIVTIILLDTLNWVPNHCKRHVDEVNKRNIFLIPNVRFANTFSPFINTELSIYGPMANSLYVYVLRDKTAWLCMFCISQHDSYWHSRQPLVIGCREHVLRAVYTVEKVSIPAFIFSFSFIILHIFYISTPETFQCLVLGTEL